MKSFYHVFILLALVVIVILLVSNTSNDNLNNNDLNNNDLNNDNLNNTIDKFSNIENGLIGSNAHKLGTYSSPNNYEPLALSNNDPIEVSNITGYQFENQLKSQSINMDMMEKGGNPQTNLAYTVLGTQFPDVMDPHYPGNSSHFISPHTYDNLHNISTKSGNNLSINTIPNKTNITTNENNQEVPFFSSNDKNLNLDEIHNLLEAKNNKNHKNYWSYEPNNIPNTNNPSLEYLLRYSKNDESSSGGRLTGGEETKDENIYRLSPDEKRLIRDINLGKKIKEQVSGDSNKFNLNTENVAEESETGDGSEGIKNIFAPNIIIQKPVYITGNIDPSSINDIMLENGYQTI